MLALVGGDERVLRLIDIALTAYAWIPANLVDLNTPEWEPTRNGIAKAIEAFGVTCVPIPWHRFPKRFHKNRPQLSLLRGKRTEAECNQYIEDLIAANAEKKPRKRRTAAVGKK